MNYLDLFLNRERLTKFFLEGKRGLLIKGGLLYADGPALTKSAAWFEGGRARGVLVDWLRGGFWLEIMAVW